MKQLKKQNLNAAVDTATMNTIGSWLQAALQAATRKKYNMKSDSKGVYIQIDSTTQIVINPTSITAGVFSKQVRKGNNVQAEPGVEYKNPTDCLTKMIQTLKGRTTASRSVPATPVDAKLFTLSASVKRAFLNMNSQGALNASRQPQRLTAALDDEVSEAPETGTSGQLDDLKAALDAAGEEYMEFPAVMFNAPGSDESGVQVVIAFYDTDEQCFVTTELDANRPGSVCTTAEEVVATYVNGTPSEGEETWMMEPGNDMDVDEGMNLDEEGDVDQW